MKIKILTLALITSSIAGYAQLTNGLVAKYSFNSGNANDEAGTNNATVYGATLSTDRFGNANKSYLFDGNDYIDCGNGSVIQNLTTSYSISAWFKRSATSSGFEVITAKWNNVQASEHFFLATVNSNVAWASAGPGNMGTADTTTFPLNTWNHVVFTWNSSGVHQVYVNNQLSTNAMLSAHTINTTIPVNFLIGAQSPSYRNFNGEIDDIRVYNRVLNISEIDSLFNEPNPLGVGISEYNINNSTIKTYPSPTHDLLTIMSSESTTISIINIIGQEIITRRIQSTETIDISNLENGIYFIKDLNSGSTIKFIKQ